MNVFCVRSKCDTNVSKGGIENVVPMAAARNTVINYESQDTALAFVGPKINVFSRGFLAEIPLDTCVKAGTVTTFVLR